MKTIQFQLLVLVFSLLSITASAQQAKEFCVMKVVIAHATSMSPPESRIVITKANAAKPVVIDLIGFSSQKYSADEDNQNNLKINAAFSDLYKEGYKLLSTASFSLPQSTVEGYNYIFEK